MDLGLLGISYDYMYAELEEERNAAAIATN
jgi:hypothetical protein